MAEVCKHLEIGLPRRRVAGLAMIDESTFARWFTRGSSSDEKGLYRDFYLAVNEAEAKLQQSVIEMIRAGGAADPKLLLNFLGRRFPDEWGRRDNVEEARVEDQAAEAKALRDTLIERFDKLQADDAPDSPPAPAKSEAPPDGQ